MNTRSHQEAQRSTAVAPHTNPKGSQRETQQQACCRRGGHPRRRSTRTVRLRRLRRRRWRTTTRELARPSTFTTWGSESEQTAVQRAHRAVRERARGRRRSSSTSSPTTRCSRTSTPSSHPGDAPDLFRVDYGNLGVYSSQDQLLDLSSYFTDDEIADFVPAMWEAVSYDGVPYGVPHQTDVSALLVNTRHGRGGRHRPVHASRPRRTTRGRGRSSRTSPTQLRAGAARRQVPVRLQLAARRRAALAELALPGRRHLPRRGRHHARRSTRPRARRRSTSPRASSRTTGCRRPARPRRTIYADNLFTEETAAMAFVGSFLVPDHGLPQRVRVDRRPDAA